MNQKDSLTDGEWETIKAVEEKQKNFHSFIKSKKGDEIDEKGAIECKSYEEFAIYWAKVAGDAETRLNYGRRKGWRKWSKKYQSFAKGVDGFMKDFSGIVDVVKGAFPPYGGIAIGTISALFIAAQHKEAMEGHLSTAISGIKDRLPGFQMYRGIYDKNTFLEVDLRKKIVNIYATFIDLCIEATMFYSEPGYYRWLMVIGNPNKFKGKADAVQALVVQIRIRCEELLSENMDKVKKLNIDLITKVSNLEGQVKNLQLDNNNAHLVQLQNSLGLGQWSSKQQRKELEDYRKALEHSNRDDDVSEFLEQMNNARLHKFKQSDTYQRWQEPGLSQIIILVAKNNENASELMRHCWASPVALSEIDDLEANSVSYAYYTLPVMGWASLHQVIPSILFQLLRLKLSALSPSGRLEDLKSKARAYENIADTEEFEDNKTLLLREMVTSVMDYLEAGETVYIIMDRVDRCKEDQQLLLLQTLALMIEKSKCTIKVLVIGNKSGWSVNRMAISKREKVEFAWLELEQKTIED